MAGRLGMTRLVSTWKFWIALAGTSMPDLDIDPPVAWRLLGLTEGDQTFQMTGTLTGISDNDTTGMRRFIRPEEGLSIGASLAQLTLENVATIMGLDASAVVGGTSGALTTKHIPLKRGFEPKAFALLARGGALTGVNSMSPYGAFPAQIWIPCGVFDGEPQLTFNKGSSPSLAFTYLAEVDDTQPAGYEFGTWIAQSE